MSGNWEFGTNDAATVKLWSEAVQRDADKAMFFAPMMYSLQDPKAIKSPDAGKTQGIIKVHTDFQSKKGDRLTVTNIADIAGRGTHGDGLLRDTGSDMDEYTMDLKFEDIAHQVRSSGPMSERRTVADFRTEARLKLARWARRKTEGAITLSLFGLNSYVNAAGALQNVWDAGETEVFKNTIVDFDSDHIMYAGDAANRAAIDSGDVLTLQFLDKLQTKAFEDLDIPLEAMIVDGKEALVLLTSGRGIEQLKADSNYREATTQVGSPDVPFLKRAAIKYGHIYVVEYPRCLKPSANVGRSILVGKDALQMAKVDDWSWFEDYEDNRKRRKVISIGAALGVAPTYFNSTRRNAIAVEHYVRS